MVLLGHAIGGASVGAHLAAATMRANPFAATHPDVISSIDNSSFYFADAFAPPDLIYSPSCRFPNVARFGAPPPSGAGDSGSIPQAPGGAGGGDDSGGSRIDPKNRKLFTAEIADGVTVEYTQDDFDDLLHDLHARSIYTAWSYGEEVERVSHPDVPGLKVLSSWSLFHGEERKAGEATWSVKEGIPPTVFIEKRGACLIDIEHSPFDLMVGFSTDDDGHYPCYIIKGSYRGRETVLALRPDRGVAGTDTISKWLKGQGFEIDAAVVTVGGRGGEGDESISFPDFPAVKIKKYTSANVMFGARGISLVDDGHVRTYAWGAGEPKDVKSVLPSEGMKEVFASVIRSAVEGVIHEYVNQDGIIDLTPAQLATIYDNVSGLESIPYLEAMFERDIASFEYGEEKYLNLWNHAATLFLADEVIRAIRPPREGIDPRIERFHSYYYAFSRIVRTADSFSSHWVQHVLYRAIGELESHYLIDGADRKFLMRMVSEGCEGGINDGIGDHDTHTCIRDYFGRYSAFPFRFLSGQLNLLSIVGGYNHHRNDTIMSLLAKHGWRSLLIAEYLRGVEGARFNRNSAGYEASRNLVEKYGFEPIGAVSAIEKGRRVESARYLLPAIEHLVTSRADLDAGREDSLVVGFLRQYEGLIGETRDARNALKSLGRFIRRSEDLDHEVDGSLGNMLVRIHRAVIEADEKSDGLLEYAIPDLSHLVDDLTELDPKVPGSLANILIERMPLFSRWGGNRMRLYDVLGIYPHVRSKAELVEILDTVEFWNDNRVNFNSLMELVKEKKNVWGDRDKETPFTPEQIGRMVVGVIKSQKPTYTVFLNGALSTDAIGKERYEVFRDFMLDEGIDIDMRMNVIGDYAEMLQLDDILFPAKRDRWERSAFALQKEEGKQLKGALDMVAGEVNSMLERIMESDPEQRLRRSRLHAVVTKKLNRLRRSLIRHILGRKLTDREVDLLGSSRNFTKILRLVSLVFTIEGGGHFRQGDMARVILRGALVKLFAHYGESSSEGMDGAIAGMNDWLMSLSKDEIRELYLEADPHRNEGRVERIMESVEGNREIRDRLVSKGYDEGLWDEGVDVTVKLSKGLSEEERREQVRTATFELVEIAQMIGVKDMGGRALSLNDASRIDSYDKAREFVQRIKLDPFSDIPDELGVRLKNILETVFDIERQAVEPGAAAAAFRATVKKELFTEAYSGVGVPGCFNPRGIAREMPFVHGAEANSGFLQAFNQKGAQVANAVVIYTDDGAYVYPGYNSSAYNMDSVFGEALKELSRRVPAIYMDSTSAGFNSLKKYASRVERKIVLPPAIFQQRYFDSGRKEDDGTLTIEKEFYVVTEESIRAGGGFENRLIKAEASDDFPDISWQDLADRFLYPDYDRYPFMRGLGNPRVLLSTIGAVKSAFLKGGWTVADDELYEEIGAIVGEKLGDAHIDVKDGVADTVIDFLETQNWPMENSSQLPNE